VINAYTFPDPVTAHDSMCEQLIWGDNTGERADYDWTHGTEVGLHNVVIGCDTIDYDYNLKKLWVPPTRWTMMVRQYIDKGALEDALAKIEDRMGPPRTARNSRGIAVLRTRLVQGKGIGRGVRRRWGSCMLSLSFRRTPVPTVTLHSRTTYFGYLALVDITVAQAFARACAEITGTDIKDVKFVWNLELAQFHGFRSLAWMLTDPEIKAEMDEAIPRRTEWSAYRKPGNQVGWRKALDGYARILKSDEAGTLYGDESFSSFARVRRRFHTEVYGTEYAAQFEGGTRNRGGKAGFPELPDLWTSNLNLAYPLTGRGSDAEWFEDDEDDEEE
jgi:hypothetical protein